MRVKALHIKELGLSTIELFVVMSLSAVILTAIVNEYTSSVKLTRDENIKVITVQTVQSVLHMMGSEIRMIGNGIPFDQENFGIGEATLTDPSVSYPIDVTVTDSDTLAFRLNETGDVYLLTQNFDPTVTNEIFLTGIDLLAVGDPIYISNGVVAGNEGFYGEITAIDTGATSVDIDATTYVTTPGATFDMGSVLEEVPVITYQSPSSTPTDGTGITRDSGFGAVIMAPNSSFTIEFLDDAGNAVATPLTDLTITDNLRALRVTVSINSTSNLSTGQPYNASSTQTFGIRNLNYTF